MAEKRSMIVYYEILEQLEDFTDEQVGKMFRAMVEYDKNGVEPNFSGEMKVAFKFIKLSIDKNKEEYTKKCDKNRENVMKRWNKDTNEYDRIPSYNSYTNDTDNDNDNDNEHDKKKENNVKEKKTKNVNSFDTTSVLCQFEFTKNALESINQWLTYKREKHQTYKETGLKTLCKRLHGWQVDFGDAYVVDAINFSISSNYDGIFPNRTTTLKVEKRKEPTTSKYGTVL